MNLLIEIKQVKKARLNFIKNFNIHDPNLISNFYNARNNNSLCSIRVHKYLTDGGQKGKVETARFLESINLNEKTIFKDLTDLDIDNIVKFLKQ